MATYTVKLTPDLVNRDTEASLDTAVVAGVSIQRTMNGILLYSGTDYRMFGNLADGDTIDDSTIPLTIGDAGYFGSYVGVE
jgi:hypothetical protein